MRTAPLDDYEEQPRGLWSRFKERVGLGDYDEEMDEMLDDPGGRRHPVTLRLHPSRMHRISVWRCIQSLDNAQEAADGLKSGHQQIVNLESASPEICGRIIDFLNGVIYALDGYVEKVGDRVYLFTPANYIIDVENGENKGSNDRFIGV
ncbi:MAG: cell division protein SepF [Armatimonadetes bacterium]|nr:cell division protein SepF [Armatimonadota bacterium]